MEKYISMNCLERRTVSCWTREVWWKFTRRVTWAELSTISCVGARWKQKSARGATTDTHAAQTRQMFLTKHSVCMRPIMLTLVLEFFRERERTFFPDSICDLNVFWCFWCHAWPNFVHILGYNNIYNCSSFQCNLTCICGSSIILEIPSKICSVVVQPGHVGPLSSLYAVDLLYDECFQ